MSIFVNHLTLAAFDPTWLLDHAALLLAGVIVLLGLIFGLDDFARFSIKRIWAISTVCFSESIRRRVLWITPLAIIGVMVVAQLQRPLDEQDAIRQTTKFCLFTTGLVVVIVAILLACTSLPKEIENRVIFTIVTKPTTRLEIVLGKTLGFARVSLAILLIMGIFTSVYLQFRAWGLQRDIAFRLETNAVDPVSRPAFEHYRTAGLLNAKTYAVTPDLQFFAKLPNAKDERRYAGASGEGQIHVPFDLTPDMFADMANPNVGFHMGVLCTLGTELAPGAKPASQPASQPTTRTITGPLPLLSSTQPTATAEPTVPMAAVGVLDADETIVLSDSDLGGKQTNVLTPGELTHFAVDFTPDAINKLAAVANSPGSRRVYISLAGSDPNYLYYAEKNACVLVVALISPDGTRTTKTILPAVDAVTGAPALPIFRGGYSRYGQQLKGNATGGPYAVYHFRNVVPTEHSGTVDFEMRMGIDRSGTENADEADTITNVTAIIRNNTNGQLSTPVTVQPETNRTTFLSFPIDAVQGGDFELILRCASPQHEIGLRPSGLAMIVNSGNFYVNLAKSLTIFWLLSILVVAVAIFCSTFVSWPIAVVLCVVVLLGHWGVEQLGDSTKKGIGAQVATDFGFRDQKQVRVVSGTVEALTTFLNTLSTILPDISQYPATEDIERGVSIPPGKLIEAMKESLSFGIPLLLLGYVIFKNKEVAP